MLVGALPTSMNLCRKKNSVKKDKVNHSFSQNQGLFRISVTVAKKGGNDLEEFGNRNVISVIVVRRDIHCIIKNSKAHREGRMPWYLVPKITHYCKVKQFHFWSMGNPSL